MRFSTFPQLPTVTHHCNTYMESLGVDELYIDKASGKNAQRLELQRMMEYVRKGDTVVVESISRFARNTRDLLELVEQLTAKQVEFVSQKEAIDIKIPCILAQLRVKYTVFFIFSKQGNTPGQKNRPLVIPYPPLSSVRLDSNQNAQICFVYIAYMRIIFICV